MGISPFKVLLRRMRVFPHQVPVVLRAPRGSVERLFQGPLGGTAAPPHRIRAALLALLSLAPAAHPTLEPSRHKPAPARPHGGRDLRLLLV